MAILDTSILTALLRARLLQLKHLVAVVVVTDEIPMFVKGNQVTNTDATDKSVVARPNFDLQPFLRATTQNCESTFDIFVCT